jgi:hypothetical protein
MSIERNVETPSGQVFKFESGMTKNEIKGMLVEVLDRGMINDRLYMGNVLPPDQHGEWVHVDAIPEYQVIGFSVDDKLGKERGLHNNGTNRTQVGDVVFMTVPKIVKEAIDEARLDRYNRMHGRDGNIPIEESNYAAEASKTADGYIKLTNTSKTEEVSGDALKANLV